MRFFNIFIAFTTLMLWGCVQDYQIPSHEFSDLAWNSNKNGERFWVLNEGEHVTMYNLSQGLVYQSWEISEGTYFLDGNFDANSDLSEHVLEDSVSYTNEKMVHIYYPTEGTYEINLNSSFEEEVYRVGFDNDTLRSTFNAEDGLWHVDTTFVVDVYGSVKPAFEVEYKGEIVLEIEGDQEVPTTDADKANWKKLEVEAGEPLIFRDLTTKGRPNTRQWLLNQAQEEESREEEFAALYSKLGTHYAGELLAIRTGDEIISSNRQRKAIPLQISVIPSSKPFFQEGDISLDVEKVIRFSVNGGVANIPANEKDHFTLKVKNAGKGFEEDILVEQVRVSDNNTVIELIPAAPVYGNDLIVVEYTGGNIMSEDGRVLQGFDATVNARIGFEVLPEDYFSFAKGQEHWDFYLSNNVFSFEEDVNGAAHVLKFSTSEVPDAHKFAILHEDKENRPFSIPSGMYNRKIRVYIEPGSMMPNVTFRAKTTNTNWWMPMVFDLSDVPQGQWVEVEAPQNIAETLEFNTPKTQFVMDKDFPRTGTIYIDYIQFIREDYRP
ncbi:hypothetical protein [Persicobacter diffluens]|uniref:Uncharacterized protein n=1 Tax=Persicobacter diffluens TaxID=981 RepID=A0AAN4W531_9BACT|nr:hypothetical protein PEDI_48170 [Persicobacter diffluens]